MNHTHPAPSCGPDIDLCDEDDCDLCSVCGGDGADTNPRYPWMEVDCEHCHGTGFEPVHSRADYDADQGDAAADQEWLEGRV